MTIGWALGVMPGALAFFTLLWLISVGGGLIIMSFWCNFAKVITKLTILFDYEHTFAWIRWP